jgi:DNA-3-methyladenine glycosylase
VKIPLSFYHSDDVVFLARSLLGKSLITYIDGKLTGGIITETEAYAGINDRASHGYGGRRSKRTEVLYQSGGISYVYLCYGVHYLFNVVTGKQDTPHAILIRAIYPTVGLKEILKRRKIKSFTKNIANGPGKLSKVLGITLVQNGISLISNSIWLEDNGFEIQTNNILESKRIGIDYAGEDAELLYRFILKSKKNTPLL